MALTKEKLGKYIELLEIRNSDLRYGVDEVRGVNTSNMISPEQQWEIPRNSVKSMGHEVVYTYYIQVGI